MSLSMLILTTFVFKIFSFNLDHWSEFSLLIDTWNYIFLVKWHQCGNSLSVCLWPDWGSLEGKVLKSSCISSTWQACLKCLWREWMNIWLNCSLCALPQSVISQINLSSKISFLNQNSNNYIFQFVVILHILFLGQRDKFSE